MNLMKDKRVIHYRPNLRRWKEIADAVGRSRRGNPSRLPQYAEKGNKTAAGNNSTYRINQTWS